MKAKQFYVVMALVIAISLVAASAVAAPGPPVAAQGDMWYVATTGNDTTGDGSQGNPWRTIQHAIGNASVLDGHTIIVAAGTYEEQVVIDKSLTLQGQGDTTIIKPSQETADVFELFSRYEGSGDNTAPIVVASGSGSTSVTIKDLKVDGSLLSSVPAGANYAINIQYRNCSGTVDSVTVEGIPITNSQGIWLSAWEYEATVEVTGCSVSGFSFCGIQASEPTLTANIHDNTITGLDPAHSQVQNGIQVAYEAKATVSSNTISMCGYSGEWKSAGVIVGVISPGTTVTVEDNTIYECYNAIDILWADNITIQNNTLYDSYTGVLIEASINNIVTGNSIRNNDHGIRLGDSPVTGNEAHFNNIVGNTEYGVFSPDVVFDAENNWWGDVSGPSGEGYGTGDAVSANVNYDPWLDAPYPEGEEITFTYVTEQTVTDDTLDAKTDADTEVDVTGTATVTVGKYSDNPGSGFGGGIDKFIDVHIDDASGVTQLEIRLYYTDAEIAGLNESLLRLRYWDGDFWEVCSDSGVNTTDTEGYSGYMWANITATSTPSLSDLTGTPFGGGELPVWNETKDLYYPNIQDAVDDADPGDTIIVGNGTYNEQLFINEKLTIVSANGSANTTINGSGLEDLCWQPGGPEGPTIYPVVWIDAAEVVFGAADQGFTITGATVYEPGGGGPEEPPVAMGVGMLNLAAGCTIQGNILDGNTVAGYMGMYEFGPSSNHILDNEFCGNVMALWLMGGGGDTISVNTFTENMCAIILEGGWEEHNGGWEEHNIDILDNTLQDNWQGIELHSSHGNTISGNDISDTTGGEWLGMPIDGVAIELVECNQNTISGNIIHNRVEFGAEWGIRLDGGSRDNDILINDISHCHYDGILLQGGSNENLVQGNTVNGSMSTIHGIALNQSNNNDVLGNEVYNCLTGIYVHTPMPECGNNIEGNIVHGCLGGIELQDSWDEMVVGNTAYNCTYGIHLVNSHGITVEDNITYLGETSPVGNSMGIYLENSGGNATAPSNTIRGNDISYNNWGLLLDELSHHNFVAANGIYYNGDGIWIEGDNNHICGNDIRHNTGVVDSGVHLGGDADNNQIHCNNIVDNTVRDGAEIISWGMYKEGGSQVDAQDNWWGDPTGPSGDGPGTGVGDAVNGYVNFAPWSTTEFAFPDTTAPVIVDTAAVSDTISLLDTEFLSWVMGNDWYSIGPSYTDLIVDTGCLPCEACGVSVDLRYLVEHMLPADIGERVLEGQEEAWHNWLNQLENTNMEYRDYYWDEEGQHCYWDYELRLDHLFTGGEWEDWNLSYFFEYEELMDMVFTEFRLGEFELPVTAVDCAGNERPDVITLAVVDFQLPMEERWNIRSTPISLDTTWGTWGQIKTMGDGLSYEALVMWDAENGQWVEPSSSAQMAPLQAYYIKLYENDQIGLIIDREATGPPQRQLYVGWNLVGLAPDFEYWLFGMPMPIEEALYSIYHAEGGVPGWGIVISPGSPGMWVEYEEEFYYNDIPLDKEPYDKWFYQEPWTPWTAYAEYGGEYWMSPGGGYWVYMDNEDILVGFSYTPLPLPWWAP